MTKFLKVIKAILISLACLVLGAYVVLYIIDKELAKQILATLVDYLNRPLPIVGVSSLVLAGLIWKIFQSTGYGKKAIAKMKEEYELEKKQVHEDYEKQKLEYTTIISMYEKENDLILDSMTQVCDAIPNKKVKEIAIKLKDDVSKVKTELKTEFNKIVDSNVQLVLESKQELVNTVVDLVKKEILDKYEEGKETINSSTETTTL